ncbi:hypothetical protein GGR50DRAFT_314267 [Xylaria sp. CBS 124048]|nr:hypothetical protein GGR50DRAFT_314267 [Xylaria sp. CBS 124048]
MSYDPITFLGLSCPSGGDFYICQDSDVEFLGCCDVDPCGANNGECPSSALSQAAFDPTQYAEIPGQSCVSSAKAALWYTCMNGPTFIGCCVSNPCADGGICPADDLVGATINEESPKDASVFLTTASSTATSTSSTSSSTSTAVTTTDTSTTTAPMASPSLDASHGTHQGGSSPSIAGIIGGVLGGIALLGLIAFISFRYGRRRRGRSPMAPSEGNPGPTSPPPWSPYHDTFRGSMAPSAAASPLSAPAPRHRSLMSLSSIVGFRRKGAGKGRESHGPTNHELSPTFRGPVAELESPPIGAIYGPGRAHDKVYFEIPGSAPEPSESSSGPRLVLSQADRPLHLEH